MSEPIDRQLRNAALNSPQGSEGLDIEIPRSAIPLPSCGLVYPLGHPLHNKDLIEVRDMTVRDEDILTSLPLIKNGTMTSTLIRACIIDKNIDTRSLIVGDRNAIVAALRISAYGRAYQAKVTCRSCDKEQDFTFDLGQIPMLDLRESLGLSEPEQLQDEYGNDVPTRPTQKLKQVQPFQNLFEIVVPSGKTIHFKFLTGADEETMIQEKEEREKRGLASDNAIANSLVASIVSINGNSDKAKLRNYIPNMSARDSLAITQLIRETQPDLIMKQDMKCQSANCGHSEEVEVPLGVGFLWPRLKR